MCREQYIFTRVTMFYDFNVHFVLSRQALLDKIYREYYPEHADSSETFDCQAEIAETLSN